ncbi:MULTISPECIES: hypothetical protein [unclassified Breznakia]|uniref:hypothetical protein n=1 Tax=unclassified Breznakia TaxID=2623764 RepID=UPI0024748B8B|nr:MULTISPECIES: hypothetical protein [unclassified Breznakia]MDH6367401.1 chromosome segregation ATPase [Breznakia sp. PH1-1]MDH6403933.1 chromosome segregation ATPase [Breznakia sp. PF1-11]MDH6411642.1 chromosome segregation ATPase [Breznakia sp. PFB1-11]MDH6414568.1 chromosome segregation ATPase [Breznakia sp. PFB1-14]MDH6418674.1 chromosome segregation ATPase [Breznakia sp. PFB1-12]
MIKKLQKEISKKEKQLEKVDERIKLLEKEKKDIAAELKPLVDIQNKINNEEKEYLKKKQQLELQIANTIEKPNDDEVEHVEY